MIPMQMAVRGAGWTLLLLLITGCPKSEGGGDKPSPSASSSAPIGMATEAGASTSGDAGAASAAGNKAGASYAGTYTLTPGVLTISDAKDYKGVKQAPDDPAKLVGDGALTLVVDADGRVSGTIDTGPASPALISGSVIDSELRGAVRRKTPSDNGLTGTFVAKVADGAVDGKMSLADTNAAIVREGKISLKKK